MVLAVRSAQDARTIATAIRDELRNIDPDIPLANVRTLDTVVADSIAPRRLSIVLLSAFSGIALLLASVGMYGVISFLVVQRTHEIGVRMALGAQATDVLGLVVRQGMNPVILGLIIGLTGTFAVGRLLAAQLYQLSPHDPFLLGAATIMLAVAALLACLLPARRATRIDPIQALRTE
jgi:putative ABC transport system permease protein